MSKTSVAILDDYQGITPEIFSYLSSRITTTSFRNTLNTKDEQQKAELIARLKPFTVVSTMRERTPLPADVIEALPNLKLILTTGPRNPTIATSACKERGIVVVGTGGRGQKGPASPAPNRGYVSTTEQNWALILGITRKVARDDAAVKSGGWQGGFATVLAGKTIGILGLGSLGVMTAKIAVAAFDMKVIAWSSSLTQEAADEKAVGAGLQKGVFTVVSKEELFRNSDILSVHYVLSERSKGIVGAKELAAMKPTSYLINTSRGPLIDEQALLEHLKAGKIGGAALDVFDTEPLQADSEWRTVKWGQDGRSEVVISPHMGYVEELVIRSMYEESAESLERWLDGKEPLLMLN